MQRGGGGCGGMHGRWHRGALRDRLGSKLEQACHCLRDRKRLLPSQSGSPHGQRVAVQREGLADVQCRLQGEGR